MNSLRLSIHRIWLSVTTPHPSVLSSDVRRVRLLLSIIVSFILLNLFGIVLVFALIEDSLQMELIFAAPCALATALTLFAYGIARSPRHMPAVYLIMLNAAILTYGAILATPGPDSATKYAPMIVLGTLIGGLFLNVRETGVVAAMLGIGLLVVMLIFPRVVTGIFGFTVEPIESFSIFVTQLIVHGMNLCILFFMDLRDRLEQERIQERTRAIEQEQLALAYKRADEVKSAFLASMSHELRTPLNAVINFTKFVQNGVMGPVNDRQKETLGKVVVNSKHLLSLINDVLDISKIEAGSLKLFVEPNIDLNPIIQTAVETTLPLLADKGVKLELDLPDQLPAIACDQQRVRQILLNIVSNACKFTEEGHIRITAHMTDNDVIISVADTGPGIAAEDHDLIFAPFRQTESGLRRADGTGLGMPISRSLAEAHGGRLWFESTVGQGSTFFVALPLNVVAEPAVV